MAFNKPSTAEAFVVNHKLPVEQQKILTNVALRVIDSRDSILEWECFRASLERSRRRDASVPVHEPPSRAASSDGSMSVKARRLESGLRHQKLGLPGGALPSFALVAKNGIVSREDREKSAREKVTSMCLTLFKRVGNTGKLKSGQDVSLYTQLFGDKGTDVPDPSLVVMLEEMFFQVKGKNDEASKTASTETVRKYVRDATVFLDWITAHSLTLDSITAFQVAAFLRDRVPLGKSVPTRCFYALRWMSDMTGVQLHTSSPFVLGQAGLSVSSDRAPPKQAKCPDVELIERIEKCCADESQPVVIRVVAGLLCCLAHGSLRWSDAQRSLELYLGRDMIRARAIMKRRSQLTPWVAARRGFSNVDWGGAWFTCLKKLGMPGPDYLLYEPVSCESVRMVPASYATIVNYMRMVLCSTPVGLAINEAIEYSMHSWRHLYPTMSNQLGLSSDQQEAIGHWKKGSAMPLHYDAEQNSLEIHAKQRVLRAVSNGFRVGKKGEFIMPEPTENRDEEPPVSEDQLVWESAEVAGTDRPARGGLSQFEVMPVHVEDLKTQKLHLYSTGKRAVCNTWDCGCPDDPLKYKNGDIRALFHPSCEAVDLKSKSLDLVCQTCFSDINAVRFSGLVTIPSYNDLFREAVDDVSSAESCLSSWSLPSADSDVC